MKALEWMKALRRDTHGQEAEIDEAIVELEELQKELSDTHYRFSCVLDNATGGRASKTNIDLNIAYKLISENTNFWVNSAVEELLELKEQK